MNRVYFAGPISINPEKAIEYKQEFLDTYADVLIKNDVNVCSPHMMYGWLNELDSYDGKGGRVETYALDSCLDFIEHTALDAVVMLTDPDEESSGMREERALAERLDLPVYNYPYFTTADDTLQPTDVDGSAFEELVQDIQSL